MSDSLRKLLTIMTPALLVIAIAFLSVILGIDFSSIPKALLIPVFYYWNYSSYICWNEEGAYTIIKMAN